MPGSILSSLFSKAQFSATDSDTGYTLWSNLKIVDVEVNAASANSDEPMGITQYQNDAAFNSLKNLDLTNNKIIQPSCIRITAIAPDLSTLEAVIAAFAKTTLTIDVSSKSVVSSSMVLSRVEIEQSPKMLSASRVMMELEQAVLPTDTGTFDPLNPGDQNTSGIRIQSLPSVTQTAQALFTKVRTFTGL